MKLRLFLLAAVLCGNQDTVADQSTHTLVECVKDVVHRNYSNPCLYRFGNCQDTALRLLKRISKQHPESVLRDFHVVIIASDAEPLRVLSARRGVTYFDFHVVVEGLGLIFDVDLGPEPTFLPFSEYSVKMFGADLSKNPPPHIRVVRIPAEEYVQARRPIKDYLETGFQIAH